MALDTTPSVEAAAGRSISGTCESGDHESQRRMVGQQRAVPSPGAWHRRAGWAVLVFLLGWLFAAGQPGFDTHGITSDEDGYHEAARRHIDWLGAPTLDAAGLEASFAHDPDVVVHPNLSRWLSGVGWWILHRHMGLDPVVALRAHGPVLYGLLAVGVVGFALSRFGPGYAACSFLLLLGLTRLSGHAHIATTEMTLATVWLFATLWALRDEGRFGWTSGALVAVGLGLALATKLSGVILVMSVLAWLVAAHRRRPCRWYLSILVLTPFVCLALHPQAWPSPDAWLLEQVSTFASRESVVTIPTLFLGEIYWHRVPVAAPLVHAVITLSPPLLLLTAVSAASGAWKCLSRERLPACIRSEWTLVWIAAVAPLLAASLPDAPAHDLERLFLPMQPLLVLVATHGLSVVVRAYRARRARSGPPGRQVEAIALAVCGVLLVPNVVETIRVRPYELTYFNGYIGGERGAQVAGFDVAYSKVEMNRSVLDAIESVVPPGERVYAHYLLADLWAHQRAGRLTPSIEFVGDPPFDWVLLYNRRSWMNPFEMSIYEEFAPVWKATHRGVLLLGLYRVSGRASP